MLLNTHNIVENAEPSVKALRSLSLIVTYNLVQDFTFHSLPYKFTFTLT